MIFFYISRTKIEPPEKILSKVSKKKKISKIFKILKLKGRKKKFR